MIGPRVGPRVGVRVGPAVGVSSDEIWVETPAGNTTLSVAITDSTDPVITAVNYTYAAVLTNTGAVDATSVSMVVTLDASLTFVSAVGTGWATGAVGQVVTCTRATAVPGAAPTVTITVTSGGSALTATTLIDATAANASAAAQQSQTTVVKLVTRDATSLVRYPNSSTEWTDFIAYHTAIGTANFPTGLVIASLYLCQEASGNLADSIDAVTLTANGTPLYQQTVTGLSRKGVGFNGVANQRFTAAAGIGPNPNTTSQYWSWDMDFTAAPASLAIVASVSDGVTSFRLSMTTAPVFQNLIGGTTANGVANPTAVGVQLVDMLYDRSGAGRAIVHTGQEIIVGTYSAAVVDGRKGLGGALSPTGHAVYGFRVDGAVAEALTDANIKALHQARGLTISW